ncbi:hypothetical protein Tsp_14814 [Trichinella spiralis]|uniref:hypothetical protein n=1 Tax=Trichinella spiralis TaxID=6334 RepID=UPI0001EFD8A6|nr:hypothetical protein Tsp_14814 [Trichinella spiralis]
MLERVSTKARRRVAPVQARHLSERRLSRADGCGWVNSALRLHFWDILDIVKKHFHLSLRIQISYHNPEVWQCVTSEFRCVRIMFELPGLPEAQCCPSQRFTTLKGDLLEANIYMAASPMILVL